MIRAISTTQSVLNRAFIALIFGTVFVGCSSSSTSLESGKGEVSDSSAVASTTLPPEADPPSSGSNSPIEFDHSCGKYQLSSDGETAVLAQDTSGTWNEVQRIEYGLRGVRDTNGLTFFVGDWSGDGQPEIVLNWYIATFDKTQGMIYAASTDDCTWQFQTIIDKSGEVGLYDDVKATVRDGLVGDGFPPDNPILRRRLVWSSEFGVWLARPLPGEDFCPIYLPETELYPRPCDIGTEVQKIQQRLLALGYSVNTDSRFTLETQDALMRFQLSMNLAPSGTMDDVTRALLFS